MHCNSPLHATYSLLTQRTVLTEDNWCSTVCRLKNPCCSLRTTVPQELDPVHTVPAHQGKHCSINIAIMIYDHKKFTTLQLRWALPTVWRTVHVHVSGTVRNSNRAPPEHEVEEVNFLSVYVYMCACVCVHTHTHIPWSHKCVTKTVGCKTSHNYTHIHNFYSVKYYKILQNSIIHHLYT